MFTISGFLKMSELDTYENGCIGSVTDCFIDMPIKCATVEDVKKEILSFVGAQADAMECDACEEIGRIDVCRTECEDGTEPSEAEIAEWKAGKLPLYYAVYTCYLHQSEPVSAA